MSSPLTAAVVGGGAGGRLSLAALAASDKFQLIAAADLRADVRAALEADFPGLRTFATHDEMFAECPTSVVCVSTYPPSHGEVVAAALRLPAIRGLLVEKPLGDTAAVGRQILDAIRARGLPVVVPHGLRSLATPQAIVREIAAGAVGELKLIEVQCDKWDLLNAGIHWVDFCLAATEETPVRAVLAACDTSTRTYRDGMQVETVAVSYVENVRGTRLIVQTGDFIDVNSPGKSTLFRLIGTGGAIDFWGWEPGYHIRNAQHPAGAMMRPEENVVTGHRFHLENLAAQIAAAATDYRWPEASQTALEIIEAAFLSHRHHCQVRFPLATFQPPAPSDWSPGQPYVGHGGGRDGRKLDSE